MAYFILKRQKCMYQCLCTFILIPQIMISYFRIHTRVHIQLRRLYAQKFNFLSYMNKSYNYIDNEVLLVTDTLNFLHRNYNLKLVCFSLTRRDERTFEPPMHNLIRHPHNSQILINMPKILKLISFI